MEKGELLKALAELNVATSRLRDAFTTALDHYNAATPEWRAGRRGEDWRVALDDIEALIDELESNLEWMPQALRLM